jgi:hypothetical protein
MLACNEHLVWGSILLLLLTHRPRVFSLDYLITRSVSHRQHVTFTRRSAFEEAIERSL